ncbi:GNAT family N-acetyltransferase [Candidatus Mycobacterium wuenschmannii]|uniref:GNAT family N-acetyltransferase n=1 Tax=Candidatus Mycobacterium wuenschmannii TaxID=3027808 RepID=A0ABY8VZ68_9MYCO|nr:GNAT family N-acetyltransferase [Candidatus Mycobacterium wuenschmannii]WIM88591.1 GNAT family N-acetyltransferase [Candidatus Mycobacterium wuenschmannii]
MAEFTPERIEGSRLLLRLPVIDDAGPLFQRVARDPQVTKYLLWTPHPTVAVTQRVIAERMNVNPHLRTWVMELQHSGEIVGMISCGRPLPYIAEIGFCVGKRWWGKGLTSEALDMLMTTLQADPDVYRAWATCHVDNDRSVRLLERAGFTREGRMARQGIYPNLSTEPLDSFLFAKALR